MGISVTHANLLLTNRTTDVGRLQEALAAQQTEQKDEYEKYNKIEDEVTISDEAAMCYEDEKNVVNKNENEVKDKSNNEEYAKDTNGIQQEMNGTQKLMQKNINNAYGVFAK